MDLEGTKTPVLTKSSTPVEHSNIPEIDLIIERPGLPRALVEIKSKDRITEDDTVHLNRFAPDIKKAMRTV